ASIEAVQKLGANVSLEQKTDGSLAGGVEGWGAAGPTQPDGPIYCANSGTTARLLMGVLAPWDITVRIEGDESLSKRPMRRITAPLMMMGAEFDPAGAETLPITEHGDRSLRAITYNSPMASAQLKTAVLLAGVYADGTTTINEPSVSRNHTELMLPEYGVKTTAGERTASVTGPVQMHSAEIRVPGDPSSAAYLVCAALLKRGSAVQIENVSLNTARTGFLITLERMGADVTTRGTGSAGKEPYGIISACYTEGLHGCEIPGHKIASLVDEVPVLSVVAAHARGITVFRNVAELRAKESDRLQAIIDTLGLLGVDAWNEGDDLFIEGQPGLKVPEGIELDARGDHRLAMSWALFGLTGDKPVKVKGFDESVGVSYPDFLEDFERLVS
ncbi:MAG: 3-phosphoshikimate 1-carboxyvinyltransferase, partial [Eggerthellaceae bacterium]|nr:3-phosphoshikimate 1-carboxyvinyltransferase [Eggerthellaceae bacterium]